MICWLFFESLFVYFVPEGTQEVQIAYLVNFRTGITATDLDADFLITDFYQIVDDFAKEGLADNYTTHAVGIGFAGKADFGRTAGEVEDGFATHTVRDNKCGRQCVL